MGKSKSREKDATEQMIGISTVEDQVFKISQNTYFTHAYQ